jgi:hypothetical protein
MLKRRLAARRVLDAELRILESRREQIVRSLRYGADARHGSFGLTIAGNF